MLGKSYSGGVYYTVCLISTPTLRIKRLLHEAIGKPSTTTTLTPSKLASSALRIYSRRLQVHAHPLGQARCGKSSTAAIMDLRSIEQKGWDVKQHHFTATRPLSPIPCCTNLELILGQQGRKCTSFAVQLTCTGSAGAKCTCE